MLIQIEGINLPGRRCQPDSEGDGYENVQVGLGSRGAAVELVPGDASTARWLIEVRVKPVDGGFFDFRGPLVEGKVGDRFIYLNWVTVEDDGSFRLFRRAKLSLMDVEAPMVERALADQLPLACTVNLTDARGQPRCARVRPPDIIWRIGA